MDVDANIIELSDTTTTDVDKARTALEIDVAIAETNVNKARAHVKRNQADVLAAQANAEIVQADMMAADLRARKARLIGDDTVAEAIAALEKDDEVLDDAVDLHDGTTDEDQRRPQDGSTNAPPRRHIWRTIGIGFIDGLHVMYIDHATSIWHHSAVKFNNEGSCDVSFTRGECQRRYHFSGGKCQQERYHLIMEAGDIIHVKQLNGRDLEVLIEMDGNGRQKIKTLHKASSLTAEDRAGGVWPADMS